MHYYKQKDFMTVQPRIPFYEMVCRLFKVRDFERAAEPLVHAAIGIIGECTELVFGESAENIIEELGDLEFYVEAAVQALCTYQPVGIEQHLIVRSEFDLAVSRFLPDVASPSFNDFLYYAGEFLNYSKKVYVYRVPMTAEMRSKLVESLAWLKACMLELYSGTHLSEDTIRSANMDKLIYGPNARYKEMQYTDKAAQERADKAGA